MVKRSHEHVNLGLVQMQVLGAAAALVLRFDIEPVASRK